MRYLWLPGFVLIAVAAFLMENPHDRTNGPANTARFLVWGLPAVLVTLSFIKTNFVSAAVNRILVPIGNASYSIYLTHPMTMIVFAFLMKHHVLGATSIPVIVPLIVVIAVVFGLLAHYVVERPILSWFQGQLGNGQSQLKKLTAANARN